MLKPVRLNTEYGPLEVDITYCDGPDCTNKGLIDYLVGWLKVSKQGLDVTTFNMKFMEDSDFCSTDCLTRMLEQ